MNADTQAYTRVGRSSLHHHGEKGGQADADHKGSKSPPTANRAPARRPALTRRGKAVNNYIWYDKQ
jgi:hypothetical protein